MTIPGNTRASVRAHAAHAAEDLTAASSPADFAGRRIHDRGRTWRPSAALKLSVAWHGAAGAALALEGGLWPWVAGAVAANHLVLLAGGLVPRSGILGQNLVRLPAAAVARREVALTFDDGPDPETTPRVLDQLDAAGVRATFFCIGHRARRHPALVCEIVARGHRVENHGDSHSRGTAMFGYARLRRDIEAAQRTLADLSGQAPRFFRPLGGFRNPFLDPVLQRLGLQQASWTRRGFDSIQPDPQVVLRRLTRRLSAGHILLLHDGDSARTPAGVAVSLEVLPQLLAALRDAQLQPVTLAEAVPH